MTLRLEHKQRIMQRVNSFFCPLPVYAGQSGENESWLFFLFAYAAGCIYFARYCASSP